MIRKMKLRQTFVASLVPVVLLLGFAALTFSPPQVAGTIKLDHAVEVLVDNQAARVSTLVMPSPFLDRRLSGDDDNDDDDDDDDDKKDADDDDKDDDKDDDDDDKDDDDKDDDDQEENDDDDDDDDVDDDDSEKRESRLDDFEDTAWALHGLLMATSWGLLAPIAIGSSLLRSYVGSSWFKIHQYCQLLVLVFTTMGFALAVINVQLDDGPSEHFDETHKRVGLTIYIGLLLQVASGLLRPHLPAANHATPVDTAAATGTSEDARDTASHTKERRGVDPPTHQESSESSSRHLDGDDADNPPNSHSVSLASQNETHQGQEQCHVPKKSPQRCFFEIQHRVLGAVLVGLAWFNCTTGINEEFEDTLALPLFWVVVGTICFFVLLLRLLIQYKQSCGKE